MTERDATAAEISPFRQSRLYAEGWNAARRSLEPSPNPYAEAPERAHWLRGYNDGQA